MKQFWIAAVALSLGSAAARADAITLTTTNPPGSPLTMQANSQSATLTVRVVNMNAPVDAMTSWFMTLTIVPNSGATGTLTFATPTTSTIASPTPHPSNYIFAQSFEGIVVTNSGSQLRGDDEDNNLSGTAVPQAGKTLLDLTFLASSTASGTFGIYALQGPGSTNWSDQTFNTQFFQNVPATGGTGTVLIGQVFVVPEPACVLAVAGLASVGLAVWRRRRAAAFDRAR
jgi:hypothetical protein